MSSHKPIRTYMGGLILGVNTLYRLFCFFKLFPMVGKGLQCLFDIVDWEHTTKMAKLVRCVHEHTTEPFSSTSVIQPSAVQLPLPPAGVGKKKYDSS